MLDSITLALRQASTQPLGLLLALALGVLSAVLSACCTLPTLGILISYSGAQSTENKTQAVKRVLFFILGTIVFLMIIGGVAGFIGQVAQNSIGTYWKIFAGIVLIFFGLATLQFLPFKLSFGRFDSIKKRIGSSGAIITGIVLGGVVAVSNLCCNPVIFVVVSIAVLQGHFFQAVLLLAMFAIGFSLPLGAILLGVSLSKVYFMKAGAEKIIRWIAGGIMLVVGFYFLITF